MRWLFRLIFIVCLFWFGWWALASYGAKKGFTALFDAHQTDGWRADVHQGGFPFRIISRLHDVSISSVQSNLTTTLDDLTLSVPTFWPGYLNLKLPETAILVQTPVNSIRIEAPMGQADLRIRPGTALVLQSIQAIAGPWNISLGQSDLIRADDLTLFAVQNAESSTQYDVALNVPSLSPGQPLRQLLSLSSDWPQAFSDLRADVALTFDKVLDRTTTEIFLDQIAVRSMQVRWGTVGLSAHGSVRIDPTGVPDGELDVQILQWRQLLDLAQSAGVLPIAVRNQSEIFLSALANLEGDPQNLDLSLAFRNGRMMLGPIDLGPAPRLR